MCRPKSHSSLACMCQGVGLLYGNIRTLQCTVQLGNPSSCYVFYHCLLHSNSSKKYNIKFNYLQLNMLG